jgi:hypothetical protein
VPGFVFPYKLTCAASSQGGQEPSLGPCDRDCPLPPCLSPSPAWAHQEGMAWLQAFLEVPTADDVCLTMAPLLGCQVLLLPKVPEKASGVNGVKADHFFQPVFFVCAGDLTRSLPQATP